MVDEATGEVILECNEEVSQEKVNELLKRGIKEFKVLFIDNLNVGPYLRETLMLDKIDSPEQAIMEIYRRLRPGDPPTPETATNLFTNLFFNPERYDLSKVGRLKLNFKFGVEEPLDGQILTKRDILEVIRYLIDLKNGKGTIDDIDHLGNRRVRAVGELLENQYRIGLVRMERAIKERMSLQEIETLMPHDLINAKPVTAVIKEFFGSSQLSQFMDQTNPLSEVTHKRRLSALGPGGLTRERAGFEVRDVHPTHYGRICPIETPEGPNIGLIASLVHLRPGERVRLRRDALPQGGGGDGVCRDVRSTRRWRRRSTPSPRPTPSSTRRASSPASSSVSRRGGEFVQARPEEVDLMDVSPNQLVSVAASLIPFLENDDANRALMGSNMQRQAVPLLRTQSPLVGTGLEAHGGPRLGRHRRGRARRRGRSRRREPHRGQGRRRRRAWPTWRPRSTSTTCVKYQRSNQNTCLNQKPIVRKGDRVKKGDVIADGPATETGELALGAERGRRLHAVAGLQLRGLDPHQRAAPQGGRLHLDPHRGVRVHRPRHQARQGRDHARHPERRRGGPQGPRRVGHHPHRRRGEAGRRAGRQDHPQG